jgi:asparagine synthase (glutamine-hydrolysing)
VATYLPGDLAVKADRAAMRHGMEVWSPFLDPAVGHVANRYRTGDLLQGSYGKMPLRRLLRGRISRKILARPKRGFGVPLAAWFRGDYGDFARERLRDRQELIDPVLGDGAVDWLLHTVSERDASLAPLLHALVVAATFDEHVVRPANRRD